MALRLLLVLENARCLVLGVWKVNLKGRRAGRGPAPRAHDATKSGDRVRWHRPARRDIYMRRPSGKPCTAKRSSITRLSTPPVMNPLHLQGRGCCRLPVERRLPFRKSEIKDHDHGGAVQKQNPDGRRAVLFWCFVRATGTARSRLPRTRVQFINRTRLNPTPTRVRHLGCA